MLTECCLLFSVLGAVNTPRPLQVFVLGLLLSSAFFVPEPSLVKDSYFFCGFLTSSTVLDLFSLEKFCA